MQTYLTMLGATVLIPSILVPAMGGTTNGKLLHAPYLLAAAGLAQQAGVCKGATSTASLPQTWRK